MRRRAAVLVDHDVREAVGDEDVAGPRMELQRDLVRHRRRRQEQRGLLPEERRRPVLQGRHGRVLAALLVADVCAGDRRAHAVRRTGGRVGAKVDHEQHPIRARSRYELLRVPAVCAPAWRLTSYSYVLVTDAPTW